MDFLRVPDVKVDKNAHEKPLFTSGRHSRFSNIKDEDEFTIYSDDELSIEIPTGSLSEASILNAADGFSLNSGNYSLSGVASPPRCVTPDSKMADSEMVTLDVSNSKVADTDDDSVFTSETNMEGDNDEGTSDKTDSRFRDTIRVHMNLHEVSMDRNSFENTSFHAATSFDSNASGGVGRADDVTDEEGASRRISETSVVSRSSVRSNKPRTKPETRATRAKDPNPFPALYSSTSSFISGELALQQLIMCMANSKKTEPVPEEEEPENERTESPKGDDDIDKHTNIETETRTLPEKERTKSYKGDNDQDNTNDNISAKESDKQTKSIEQATRTTDNASNEHFESENIENENKASDKTNSKQAKSSDVGTEYRESEAAYKESNNDNNPNCDSNVSDGSIGHAKGKNMKFPGDNQQNEGGAEDSEREATHDGREETHDEREATHEGIKTDSEDGDDDDNGENEDDNDDVVENDDNDVDDDDEEEEEFSNTESDYSEYDDSIGASDELGTHSGNSSADNSDWEEVYVPLEVLEALTSDTADSLQIQRVGDVDTDADGTDEEDGEEENDTDSADDDDKSESGIENQSSAGNAEIVDTGPSSRSNQNGEMVAGENEANDRNVEIKNTGENRDGNRALKYSGAEKCVVMDTAKVKTETAEQSVGGNIQLDKLDDSRLHVDSRVDTATKQHGSSIKANGRSDTASHLSCTNTNSQALSPVSLNAINVKTEETKTSISNHGSPLLGRNSKLSGETKEAKSGKGARTIPAHNSGACGATESASVTTGAVSGVGYAVYKGPANARHKSQMTNSNSRTTHVETENELLEKASHPNVLKFRDPHQYSSSLDTYDKSKQCRKLKLSTRNRRRISPTADQGSDDPDEAQATALQAARDKYSRSRSAPLVLNRQKTRRVQLLKQDKARALDGDNVSVNTTVSELSLSNSNQPSATVKGSYNRDVATPNISKQTHTTTKEPLIYPNIKQNVTKELSSSLQTQTRKSPLSLTNSPSNKQTTLDRKRFQETHTSSISMRNNREIERSYNRAGAIGNGNGAIKHSPQLEPGIDRLSCNHPNKLPASPLDNNYQKNNKTKESNPQINSLMSSPSSKCNNRGEAETPGKPLSLSEHHPRRPGFKSTARGVALVAHRPGAARTPVGTNSGANNINNFKPSSQISSNNNNNNNSNNNKLATSPSDGAAVTMRRTTERQQSHSNDTVTKETEYGNGHLHGTGYNQGTGHVNGTSYVHGAGHGKVNENRGVGGSNKGCLRDKKSLVKPKTSALLKRTRGEPVLSSGELTAASRVSEDVPLTDTARLHTIRKLLRLPEVPYGDNDAGSDASTPSSESCLIIQEIMRDVLYDVYQQCKTEEPPITTIKRCTTTDEDGSEMLCCILQTPTTTSRYICDVIDPLDVAPVIKNYERLVSNILKVATSRNQPPGTQFKETLVLGIPIAHWYVETWQEVLVRHTDKSGRWRPSDDILDVTVIANNSDTEVYGVQVCLTEACCVAVVSRPKQTTVDMTTQDQVAHALSDDRVKMNISGSNQEKNISLQVVPVDVTAVEHFQRRPSEKAGCGIVSSTSLVQVSISDGEPESLEFEVPYVTGTTARDCRSPGRRNVIQSPRSPEKKPRDKMTSYLSTSTGQTIRRQPMGFSKDMNQAVFHLVHVSEAGDVKIKLLETADEKNKNSGVIQYGGQKNSSSDDDSDKSVKFTVYDRDARIIVVETRGSLLYSDVQRVTQSFVDTVIKHRVRMCMFQDSQNVFSILFTAQTDDALGPHTNVPESPHKRGPQVEKEIFLDEGEVVAIVFRGNVEVPESKELVFSFHGFRGIKRELGIEVSNPMSQRSLQTYHGALQIYTLKEARRTALDRSQFPCVKNGWKLSVEFPLLLPKFLKNSPVIINKAPIAIKFNEPLTIDFVRMLCNELTSDWVTFAKALGLGHARIQSIKQQHRNLVSEKVVMDVIVSWMKTRTIAQDRVTPIVNALLCCEKVKLAAELAQRQTSIKTSRKQNVKDRNLQRAFAAIGKSRGVVARWRLIFHHLNHMDDCQTVDVTERIDGRYGDDYAKCQGALGYWKDNSAAPTVWTLVDALRASHCNVVADTIVAMETRTVK